MSSWPRIKLRDAVEINYGKNLPEIKRVNGDTPVFSSAGITGCHNVPLVSSRGIIIGRKGTIGSVYYSSTPFFAIDTTYFIKPNDSRYDLKFLYYLLGSIGLEELNEDSAVPGLNRDTAYAQEVLWPTLPEQRAIAAVLSSLDDKIDLLHRQNKTLESLASTLWRKMFIEEAATWRKGVLGDIAEINPLRSIKKGAIATYLDMSNMPNNGSFPQGWIQREFTSGMKFKNGDTLIARITPCLENGKTAYVDFLGHEEIAWGSTEYIVLAPKSSNSPEWLYFLARSEDFRDFAIQNMTGTSGRQRVSGESISQYELAIPSVITLEQFAKYAGPTMAHINRNSFQIRTVSDLRDTLLPKLMSGEVVVE